MEWMGWFFSFVLVLGVVLGPRLYLMTKTGIMHQELIKRQPELVHIERYYIFGALGWALIGSGGLLLFVWWVSTQPQLQTRVDIGLAVLAGVILSGFGLLAGLFAWRFGVYPTSAWSAGNMSYAYEPPGTRIRAIGRGQALVCGSIMLVSCIYIVGQIRGVGS